MRILILAPLGALFACADSAGTYGEQEPSSYSEREPNEETDPEDVRDSLRGDYATCNDALVGLGFTPWTDYVEEETADAFYVYEDEDDPTVRPWVATLTFTDEEPGYHITCGVIEATRAYMWVDRAQDEYWSCAFQFDRIGILDPESDPACSEGLSDEADRADYVDGEAYDYVRAEPGLYVAEE